MTEAEWMACTDPTRMLVFLRGKASERKLRLFAVACCRRIWDRLRDREVRQAVETVASFIEGRAAPESLESAGREVERLQQAAQAHLDAGATAVLALTLIPFWNADRWPCLGSVLTFADQAAAYRAESTGRNRKQRKQLVHRSSAAEQAAQCGMIRDLLSNPFRPPPPIPASVLQWNEGLVRRLAQQAYEERQLPSGQLDPERLAVLADAMEEAGAEADLLAHLRQPGAVHVRGCWAVDLALGRE